MSQSPDWALAALILHSHLPVRWGNSPNADQTRAVCGPVSNFERWSHCHKSPVDERAVAFPVCSELENTSLVPISKFPRHFSISKTSLPYVPVFTFQSIPVPILILTRAIITSLIPLLFTPGSIFPLLLSLLQILIDQSIAKPFTHFDFRGYTLHSLRQYNRTPFVSLQAVGRHCASRTTPP